MKRIIKATTNEANAGFILMGSALFALLWANSPWRASYEHISHISFGWELIHMSASHWAADGLLAIFFFIVGLELKEELTIGSLRDPKKAAVPVVSAIAGVALPAAVYLGVQAATSSGHNAGWAIPAATDIAFALAILAIFGRGLPPATRTFLMTLAVADDLIAIAIIALFFSSGISLAWLAASAAMVAIFALLTRKFIISWWLLWPIGILAWSFMYLSGIHATIAGVALGLSVTTAMRPGKNIPLTHEFIGKIAPLSSALAMPVFAFFASGINLVDSSGFTSMLSEPVAIGVYLGLPLGKFLGIMGAIFFMTKLAKMKLDSTISMADLLPISLVAGIGFTVSLLIAQLTYPDGDPLSSTARFSVLIGTLISALLGILALRIRSAQLRKRRMEHASHRHRGEEIKDDF